MQAAADEPAAFWYRPVTHAMQVSCSADGWCRPAAQSVQLPGEPAVPAAHGGGD